jgi:hypothetical protein
MPMRSVISASRRTDIPAFYMPWLLDAVRNRAVHVANPYNRTQVRRVSLDPMEVAWFVFWSRNYAALLRHREAFSEYKCAFHFTITSGDPLMEPSVPTVDSALRQTEQLARHYGGERVFWRYDPIVHWRDLNGDMHTNHQLHTFERLANELGAIGVKRCIMSFAQYYAKVRLRLKRQGIVPVAPPDDVKLSITTELRDVATANGISLSSCCSTLPAGVTGVDSAKCIDGRLLTQLGGEPVSVARNATRDGCSCTKSIDIGDYQQQPCAHGCLYCYANPGGATRLHSVDR